MRHVIIIYIINCDIYYLLFWWAADAGRAGGDRSDGRPVNQFTEITEQKLTLQVLQEKQASVGKGMMGTSHVYDLKKSDGREKGAEVSLNPEDLDLDPAAIAAKYQSRTQPQGKEKEDMR